MSPVDDDGLLMDEVYIQVLGIIVSILLLWILTLIAVCYFGCGRQKDKKRKDAEKGNSAAKIAYRAW